MATIKKTITARVGLIYMGLLLGGFLVLGKALYTQISCSVTNPYKVKELEIPSTRGNICAEDGRALACSVPYYRIFFDATVCHDTIFRRSLDSLAYRLSRFFGDRSAQDYASALRNARKTGRHYELINRRKVSYLELKKLRTFPIFRLGRNRGGFIEERTSERIQPLGELASRTIGYLNESQGEVTGRVGIEQAFESSLRGLPGHSIIENMSGQKVPVTIEEPVDGYDVITTINLDYQDIVQSALLHQMEFYRAKGGTAILMEVKTGDIKAIANLSRTENGTYKESVNHAIRESGEPGSVMKAATMMALFEAGDYEPDQVIDLGGKGEYHFYDKKLVDSGDEKYGKITVQHIFEVSSNGIARLVFDKYKNNPEKFISRWSQFGLDKPVGLQIKGESQPFILHPKDKGWSGISLPWMSIGYNVQLAPLQVLAFYNAIANDGQRVRPRIVKEIRNGVDVVERFPVDEVGYQICGKSTLRKIHRLLEGVVENGTAQNIKNNRFKIAGKTGTARIATGNGGYDVRRYKTSFVGYFPADKPLYSCIVTIDEPVTYVGYYAAQVCSPVFAEIANKVYAMASVSYGTTDLDDVMSVPVCKNGYKSDLLTVFDDFDIDVNDNEVSEDEWVMTQASENNDEVDMKRRRIATSTVPNVKGMGLRDALFVLENIGLQVGFSGSGMVMSQSIQPGSAFRNGNYIHLELR